MYKIIDLGFEVQDTGERRVTLLDQVLTKTASSEIQTFWDSLNRKPNYSYLWVIGVSAVEYYGCNNNGDAFTESDLKKCHHTFVDNAHVFLHHVNKDPNKSIGKPVYSFYNDVMHRVEIIMEINKSLPEAMETVTKIRNGEPIYVSMGCNVANDICSICNNHAKTRAQYCEHLKYNMKKILPDGRQVFAYNPSPKFFDISIVRKPADPTAFTLDKVASENHSYYPEMSSAELGEQAISATEKLAALKKVSDIIKRVEGQITDLKEDDGEYNILRAVARNGFDNFDYPDFKLNDLVENNVEPCDLIRGLASEGAPITFGDAAYMAGRSFFGNELNPSIMRQIINIVPAALRVLQHSPQNLMDAASPIFSRPSSNQEIVIRIIRPVAQARVHIFSKMASEKELEKLAAGIPGVTMPFAHEVPNIDNNRITNLVSSQLPGNLRTTHVRCADGHIYTTDLGTVRESANIEFIGGIPGKVMGAGLATAAVFAILADPTKVENIIAGVASGALGASLLLDTSHTIRDVHGNKIPASTHFYKKASTKAPVSMLTYAGMAIPGALGLDYLYNKWKYKGEDPEPYLTTPGKYMNRAGKFVVDHPIASTALSTLTGASIAKKFRRA